MGMDGERTYLTAFRNIRSIRKLINATGELLLTLPFRGDAYRTGLAIIDVEKSIDKLEQELKKRQEEDNKEK